MAAIPALSGALPLVVGSICLLYLCYRRLLVKPLPGIPYNKDAAYTLFGDIPKAMKVYTKRKALFPWLIDHMVKYQTPIFQIFMRPFGRPWVLISDPREAQDLLLRRTKEFDRSPITGDVFASMAPSFHISMKTFTDEFKMHKNLVKDLMTPAFLNNVAARQIAISAMNLVQYWSLKSELSQDRPFEAFHDVYNTFLDTITAVTFGLDPKDSVTATRTRRLRESRAVSISPDREGVVEFDTAPRPPTYEALVKITSSLDGVVQSPSPAWAHWLVTKTPSYKRAYAIKEKMIHDELEKGVLRFQGGDVSERCALDNVLHRELTAATKANRQPDYHNRAVYDELMGFIIGSYETTGSTMCWGWKYMSTYIDVQNTLQTQLRAAFPAAIAEGRSPTADEITRAHIPYLEATIEEIHRVAQIFPIIFRRAIVDTTLMGHDIKKGTDIAIGAIGPGYTSPLLPVPDNLRSESSLTAKYQVGEWDPATMSEFRPERWLRKDDTGAVVFDPQAGPHLTFSLGPRACFGRRLAYLQMRIKLALVLWNLEFLPVEGVLGNFDRLEKLAAVPINCYIKVRPVRVDEKA